MFLPEGGGMSEFQYENWICSVEQGEFRDIIQLTNGSSESKYTWLFGNEDHSALAYTGTPLEWEESRGFFRWSPKGRRFSKGFKVQDIEIREGGFFLQTRVGSPNKPLETWHSITVAFIPYSPTECSFQMAADSQEVCGLRMSISSHPTERIFGTGTQFTHINLKKHRVPVISQEPGIGRGVQPLTFLLNLAYGAGGTSLNSNAPSGHFLSSAGYGWMTDNTEPVFLDFTGESAHMLEIESSEFSGSLFSGSSPKKLTEQFTRHCGRMRPLPSWVHEGAIIGLQGGSEVLTERVKQLQDADTAVAGYWLQDWVGQRTTSVGKQLWWNWELDEQHYPDWKERVDSAEHPRLLTYTNPFLVDPSEKGAYQRNLYQEAKERGFLVTRKDGKPYPITNTSFDAALVDLGNPEARSWLREVLKRQISESGSSGWMADFGEALPFDAVLPSGQSPLKYHNQYPVDWAGLNREAIEELDKGKEAFFFTRGGHTKSPGQSTCFWLGDQLTSWKQEDGIWSALAGLLSSGFSGFSLNHSDVGGYTTTAVPGTPKWLPGLIFKRSRELLMRWAELNTFTALLRTHEGNRPEANHQIWDSPEALSHFAHCSRLFAALAPYRRQLEVEAQEKGYPLVRHPYLVFPKETITQDLHDQFFLGDDLLVAPILHEGKTSREVWLPGDDWCGVWDDTQHGSGIQVQNAPIGRPLVWYRKASPWSDVFRSLGQLGPWEGIS